MTTSITDRRAGPVQRRPRWRVLAALAVPLALALACGSSEEEPLPDDVVEAPDEGEPVDTGFPDEEPPPRRGRGRGGEDDRRKEKGRSQTKCVGASGSNMAADIRLVFEGMELVGGSLSYEDKQSGRSDLVEPLTGSRTKDRLEASGKGKKGKTQLVIERRGKGLQVSIDGTAIDGKAKPGPCND